MAASLMEALNQLAAARTPVDLWSTLKQAASTLGLQVTAQPADPSALALRSLDGNVQGYLTAGADAAALAAAWAVAQAYCQEMAVQRSARRRLVWDPATGLWTTLGIRERLHAEIARSSRRGTDLAVLVLSAPDADALLTVLQSRLRVSDYLGLVDRRFCVVLPETTPAAAQDLFRFLQHALLPRRLTGGVAFFRGAETAADLLEDALAAHDRALMQEESRLAGLDADPPAEAAAGPKAEPAPDSPVLPAGVLPAAYFKTRAQRLLQLALLRGAPLTVLWADRLCPPPALTLPRDVTALWGALGGVTVGLVNLPAAALSLPAGSAVQWESYTGTDEETLADLLQHAGVSPADDRMH